MGEDGRSDFEKLIDKEVGRVRGTINSHRKAGPVHLDKLREDLEDGAKGGTWEERYRTLKREHREEVEVYRQRIAHLENLLAKEKRLTDKLIDKV